MDHFDGSSMVVCSEEEKVECFASLIGQMLTCLTEVQLNICLLDGCLSCLLKVEILTCQSVI